ncbi:patatin-like phospholipase family protein [Roseospira navarrensis]|uniref:BamA/TamA family outer membrane protein n=1 Tax=Roseospira navarrensis TaxID=140058 RepID=A0A7X2D2L8_9PROT|nr:patatin-like phospholipase family protein [Roseospira navarrensis]MQX35918.1 BamA/TamA family outer membrane protein [Roseospira navarrensis]
MLRPVLLLALLCALFSPPSALAQTAAPTAAAGPHSETGRPRIGLVLAGGGALGAAHVGVIQVLERLGVPVDMVAGTSMGALVGGLYATGRSGDELAETLKAVDWADAFRDSPPRADRPYYRRREDLDYLVDTRLAVREDGAVGGPLGLVQGQRIGLILKRLTLGAAHVSDFDALPRPFRAVAVDVESGHPVVLGSGSLPVAMRASMSVPGVFPPVEIDGQWLLDGGVVNNLPVDVARAMGADRLIVVNLPANLSPRDEMTSPLAVLGQMISVAIDTNANAQLANLRPGDILIEPDLGDMTATDFDRVADAVGLGAEAAEAQAPALRRLAETLAQAGPPAPRPVAVDATVSDADPDTSNVIVTDIRSDGDGTLSDRVILGYITQTVGAPLDLDQLERDLATLYGLDVFERVDWGLEPAADGRTGTLVIISRARAWGTDSIQFGARLSDDFQGNATYGLSAAYTFRPLNDRGGSLQLGAEIGNRPSLSARLLQPLDDGQDWILGARLSAERGERRLYTETRGRQAGVYDLALIQGEASMARTLGDWGAARGGLRLATGWIEPTFSGGASGGTRLQGAFVFGGVSVDTLDSVTWPRSGSLVQAEVRRSLPALGADASYSQIDLEAWTALSWGPNTLVPRLAAGYTLDGEAPVPALFGLGGFLSLSGYGETRFLGQNRLLGALTYMRRLTDGTFSPLDVPLYAGTSIEAGNVWGNRGLLPDDLRYSGSLFAGADTPFGPAFLGVGLAALDSHSVFLRLGRPF